MESFDPASHPAGQVADPINAIALPIFALIGILVMYLPFRSFYAHRNIAACSIVFVVAIYNIFVFVNAIIWNTDDWTTWWTGEGLCDIEALLRYPITMALATSLCCLTKGLADCLDTENAKLNPSASMKRRKRIVDFLFCWAIPILQMALHYVVQAGRYAIVPVFGCADAFDNSWPTIVILLVWLPLFGILNCYWACLLLFRLRKHRKAISNTLTTTGSGMGTRKYLKLVFIAFGLLFIYLPVQIVFFFRSLPTKLDSYSWSRVHNPITWSPVAFLHTEDVPTFQYNGWAGIGMSFVLFVYFGFNDEAIDTYRRWLCVLGFGKWFPSLKGPRIRTQSMASRNSWTSQLDVVGKAMKWFDIDLRKSSQATTCVGEKGSESHTSTYRKGSQATFINIPLTTITSHELDYDHDAITILPPPFPHLPSTTNPNPNPISFPSPPPTHQPRHSLGLGNIFSLFRTTIPLPLLPLHSHSNTTTPSKTKTHTRPQQQQQQPGIRTTIWSSPLPPAHRSHSPVPSPTHSTSHPSSPSDHTQPKEDSGMPKMGTKAYREMKKREYEARHESEKKSVLADEVKIEGLDVEGKGEGVVVYTQVERRESEVGAGSESDNEK